MLERKEVPPFALPSGLNILEQKELKLNNGIPVKCIRGGSQEVTKIDFVFSAGVVQSPKALVAAVTNALMQEGTKSMSAFEIAEKIDFYGAYLGQSTNYHHAQVTLYALAKYLPDVLPILEEIIKKPSFARHEFDVHMAKKKQDFMVDSEKVKTLAHRRSQEVLFGEGHPYGRVAKLRHFDEITVNDVKDYHKKQYASNLCTIIVSGQPGDDLPDLLNQYFGEDDWANDTRDNHELPDFCSDSKGFHLVHKENAMQSAIRIVRSCVTKAEPDYLSLLVLNTLFGGYFGSRLMNNLREEKGLTYGISSYLVSFLKSGVFGISTEVVAEKRELAVSEIFKEMDRLRNELVDEEELTTVKNYMLGDLMRNLDGPFAISDASRGLLGFDLDFSYFARLEKVIKEMTPKKMQELANKYLVEDDFYVVIAGK